MSKNTRDKSRRVVLSKEREQQIVKEIIVYEVPINEGLELHIRIDEAVSKKAATYIEAIVNSRKIPRPSNINAQYKGVLHLATAMFEQQKNVDKLPAWMQSALGPKKKSPRDFLQDAIERWQTHAEAYLNVAQVEGFIAALVSEGTLIHTSYDDEGNVVSKESIERGFFTRTFEGGYQIYDVNPLIEADEVPVDYFNFDELNAERLANSMPPVPSRDVRIAQEQMLALIDAVKRKNTDFAFGLETFFDEYSNSVMGKALNIAQEVALEYDEDGFQSGTVDEHPSGTDGTTDPA